MSCCGEVERFQESGRISQVDDVVETKLGGVGLVGNFGRVNVPSQTLSIR